MLFEMVRKLSATLEINMVNSELRDVYRVPTKPDQSNSAIVAEFSLTLLKESFLTATRNHRLSSIKSKTKQLNSSHLGLDGPKVEVYISEDLTPQASRLFYLSREFRKEMEYAYCWTANGLVYLRKKQGDPFILVRSEAQLQLLKNK